MWTQKIHTGNNEIPMQKSSALFGMVSHCQTPSFSDFTGLTLSMYSSKSDICARRIGNDGFGAQSHMQCPSPKRHAAPEERYGSQEKGLLTAKSPRACFSLSPEQGKGLTFDSTRSSVSHNVFCCLATVFLGWWNVRSKSKLYHANIGEILTQWLTFVASNFHFLC